MKKLLIITAIVALIVSCNTAKKDSADENEFKSVVLYYSQTGVTKQLAEEFADLLGIEAYSFDVENPYDGTYEETINRCRQEQETDSLSPIKPLDINLDDYEIIFLGYPIWFGTYARPVMSLLKDVDLKNKIIVPFCTFGSGGLGSSVAALREALPDATVIEGYGVRQARVDKSKEEVEHFLIEKGYLDGEVDELAEFSPQEPVDVVTKSVFAAACSEYPMPLGEPITYGKRDKDGGTEYMFKVIGTAPNGESVESYVFITCHEGETPEFTRVER